MNPLVSVIIPTYNRGYCIKRSIFSVLNQTYKNIELIIVDDGSTDNTENVIQDIIATDSRVIYKKKKNGGACSARNMGINMARGKYIAFQDSDDYWYKDKLSTQIAILEKEKSDAVYCRMKSYGVGDINNTIVPNINLNSTQLNLDLLLQQNYISTQMLVVKSSIAKTIMFDNNLPRFQDWDFAIQLLSQYNTSFCDQILVNQYVQKDSISNNLVKAYKGYKYIFNKYQTLFNGFPLAESRLLYLMGCVYPYEDKSIPRAYFRRSLLTKLSIRTFCHLIRTYF